MKVVFVIVQYGHLIIEPAVPSAESIDTGAVGNDWVRSCRNNSRCQGGAEKRVSGSPGLAASTPVHGIGWVTCLTDVNCLRHRKRTFGKVEWVLGHCLWRWAKRRHPGKSSQWIDRRYWHPIGGRKVFAADSGKRTRDGNVLWWQLVLPSSITIRRHVKIKAAANPFDPQWSDYFDDRAFFKQFGCHRQKTGYKPSR